MTNIALVTGANKGMGFEVARQLAEHGMTVVVGSRDAGRGEQAVATLRARGLDTHAIEIDVTDDASITRAATQLQQKFGRLDVLVNNAGTAGKKGANTAPGETTREGLEEIFQTNVFGLVAVTNAMLPLLRESESPRIVNVSSEVASLTTITNPSSAMFGMFDLAYPASKSAVNMVTTMYAKELHDAGFKVNASIPGYVKTDLNDGAGMLTAAEGAAATVALALILDDGPTGEYRGSLSTNNPGDFSVAPW